MFEFMVTVNFVSDASVSESVFADSERSAVEAVMNTLSQWDEVSSVEVLTNTGN